MHKAKSKIRREGEIRMVKDKVGFIGLGAMGKPMARNLIKRGIETIVYDVREEPVKELEKLGAKFAGSTKEIGSLCDFVIIMVNNTAQTEEIILGDEGILSSMGKGSIIVIMSTVDPLLCQRVANIAQEKGIGVIDAPVSSSITAGAKGVGGGGPKGAETGTLTIMVGGKKDLFERCRYVLEAMGSQILHVGDIGTAQAVKLASNSIVYATAVATAGGIALAAKAGINLERFLEIIRSNAANSWVAHNWEHWRKKAKPEGKISLGITYKDLGLALDLAKAWGISLPLGEIIAQLDIAKIIEHTEKLCSEVPDGN